MLQLPPIIEEQKNLMTSALKTLQLIESAQWLLSYDKPMQKISIENLHKEYAQIMSNLLGQLVLQGTKTQEA